MDIINFAKPFLNFLDDTIDLISKFKVELIFLLRLGLSELNSMVIWCISYRRFLALIVFHRSLLNNFPL